MHHQTASRIKSRLAKPVTTMNKNDKKKEKFPSKLEYKGTILVILIISIISLIFFIRNSFILPHHGDKINQAGIDALLNIARIFVLLCAPLASIFLFYISIVMWLYFKKCNSDSGQSVKDEDNQSKHDPSN
jgi:preprotein translocase subunit SecY